MGRRTCFLTRAVSHLTRYVVTPLGQGEQPPKYLAYLVALRFERRRIKQNTVARLKSKYLAPPNILGWLRYWKTQCKLWKLCLNARNISTTRFRKASNEKSMLFCVEKVSVDKSNNS